MHPSVPFNNALSKTPDIEQKGVRNLIASNPLSSFIYTKLDFTGYRIAGSRLVLSWRLALFDVY